MNKPLRKEVDGLEVVEEVEEDLALELDEETEEVAPDKQTVFDFLQVFPSDSRKVAEFYILQFFKGQDMYCGGPIPKSILLSNHYVKMVLDTDIGHGADMVYELLQESGRITPRPRSVIPQDTQIFLEVQRLCRQISIPKCFVGGITMMYLELCKGFKPRRLLAKSGF